MWILQSKIKLCLRNEDKYTNESIPEMKNIHMHCSRSSKLLNTKLTINNQQYGTRTKIVQVCHFRAFPAPEHGKPYLFRIFQLKEKVPFLKLFRFFQIESPWQIKLKNLKPWHAHGLSLLFLIALRLRNKDSIIVNLDWIYWWRHLYKKMHIFCIVSNVWNSTSTNNEQKQSSRGVL